MALVPGRRQGHEVPASSAAGALAPSVVLMLAIHDSLLMLHAISLMPPQSLVRNVVHSIVESKPLPVFPPYPDDDRLGCLPQVALRDHLTPGSGFLGLPAPDDCLPLTHRGTRYWLPG